MEVISKSVKIESRSENREESISHSPVKLIDEVILRAYTENASDIHFEPLEAECRVRMRVDGSLIYVGRYKKEIHEEAIARLKVLSSLRTDVRMLPQDGRFKVNVTSVPVNIRVSVIPSLFGEKCVLRLLPQTIHTHTLESLGFSTENIKKISQAMSSSNGMVLTVGPTGSGKTTTLYTLLKAVSLPDISTVTLEDPVEYSLGEITQIPIHVNAGLTFASALRAVVRQDPDVIMVGEIRDRATAELSVQAALTGHLLLSTLHTNDAITALPRLVDMGVEPFLVASTIRAIISQRLVRKICQKCLLERKITVSELQFLEKIKIQLGNTWEVMTDSVCYGRGCKECRNTGYRGRIVVSEVLIIDGKIREMIMNKFSSDALFKQAIDTGMKPLIWDALEKVKQNKTTLEEISFLI